MIKNAIIKKSYLFGLLYYKQSLESYRKEFRVFGLPVWKKKVKSGILKFYLFGFTYFIKSSRKLLYKTILEKIDKKYENIFINFNCSGETYLFLAYLNPPDNSLFIATKKYHIDLCKMIHPNIDCIYLPEILPLRSLDNVFEDKYKGKKFYNVLPFKHFINLENKIRNGENVHYCKEICKTIKIEYSKTVHLPEISDETKQSALKKAKRIGLNLNNFIFICPESMSNESPNKNYWCDLCDKYYDMGFDIFINAINQSPDYGIGKTCFLTFDEAYYIASLSKKIIGLRSGFIEILTSIKNVPIICLYTDFKDRGILKPIEANKVMQSFNLKELPNASEENITELIYKSMESVNE